jgi:hypothetical protein
MSHTILPALSLSNIILQMVAKKEEIHYQIPTLNVSSPDPGAE